MEGPRAERARPGGAEGGESGVRIRPAIESDSRRIQVLVRRERLNPTGLSWPRFLVALDEAGNVVGCVQVKPVGGGARELASLVVDPEWRGRRVGASLVRRLMEQEGPPLWLMCRSGLHGYYEQFGFRAVAAGAPQPRHFTRMRRFAAAMRMMIGAREELTVMVWEAAPR